MTWQQLLAELRADLQDDAATNPRWSDKTLYIYIKDAVRDYSIWFPLRIDAFEIAPVNGAYPLPANFIEDIQLECPVGTFLERRQVRPGVRYGKTSTPLYYYVSGGKIYLSNAVSDNVLLTYNAAHPVPTSESDTTFVFTVADVDMELLRLYAKARVYGQMRSRQAALDRFKVAGKRDDNPLIPETEDLMGQYNQKITDRIDGGVIILYRQGPLK